MAKRTMRPDASGVLSIRMPLDQIRMLRELAVRRGMSLSALLQELAAASVANEDQRMFVSRSASRVQVSGVGLRASVEPEGPSTRTWSAGDDHAAVVTRA